MQAHTRKHLIKEHREERDSIPWREVFADIIEKYGEAACSLRGLRYREDLTQAELCEKIGITQSNLSAMERGKRPIGKAMARKFAKFFNTDYKKFL